MDDAIHREKQLKNWHRQWKVNLITEFNPQWQDLSDCLWMRHYVIPNSVILNLFQDQDLDLMTVASTVWGTPSSLTRRPELVSGSRTISLALIAWGTETSSAWRLWFSMTVVIHHDSTVIPNSTSRTRHPEFISGSHTFGTRPTTTTKSFTISVNVCYRQQ